MKRSWDKPEMIVLVKRKSDEIILAGCKMSGGNPSYFNASCAKGSYDTNACYIMGCQV
jgi:hypothetical protein